VIKTLPRGSIHLGCTSPPYWGQRLYGWGGKSTCKHKWDRADPIMTCEKCGMKAPILGLEDTPEAHIEKLVEIFREFKRVLRDDGVLVVNYGDKYNGSHGTGGNPGEKQYTNIGSRREPLQVNNLQQGDLIGLPWLLAFALQKDGWILRSDTIWAKAISFGAHECPHCGKALYQSLGGGEDLFGDCIEPEIINHKKSGSTMPESINGWRWERHKVKVKKGDVSRWGQIPKGMNTNHNIKWRDCPGCPQCSPNDGLVLRKGSWRPTSAHEHLLIFTKQMNYFCDMEAVREAHLEPERSGKKEKMWSPNIPTNEQMVQGGFGRGKYDMRIYNPSGRNLRNVWCINPQAYKGVHYATFAEKLIEPVIKVATSEKGCCPKCGSQWARVVDRGELKPDNPSYKPRGRKKPDAMIKLAMTPAGETQGHPNFHYEQITLDWRATCNCGLEPVPSVVCDMFAGSGTTLAVAARLNRNYTGVEINPEYIENQAVYRVAEGETGLTPQEQRKGQKGLFECL